MYPTVTRMTHSVVLCTEAVHSHKHIQMSSSYSSLDWALSHWAHFTVHRFICVYLCVFCVFLFHTAYMSYSQAAKASGKWAGQLPFSLFPLFP